MPRNVRPGLSGIAVLFAGLGGWMVYAAVRDVDPVYGLGSLLRGDKPESRTPGGSKDIAASRGSGGRDLGSDSGSTPVDKSGTTVTDGIRVKTSFAPSVHRLITDAKASGLTGISGHGWRSNAEQRALRVMHGYTSDDQKSGSGGRIPTAVPGTSMHEAGLAIDFTNHGKSLTRHDPVFTWLASNGASYGVRNLSSEPWHWSTNGH